MIASPAAVAPRARTELPILLIEDNDGDAELIVDLLSEGPALPRREVLRASRLSQAKAVLGEHRVGAVLLDLGLPDGAGVDCVRAVRAQVQDVPIVVLTGLDDDQMAMSCLAAGAQDYLSKQDVRPRTLARAIDYAVVRASEAEERERAHRLQLRSAELELENRRVVESSRLKNQFLAHMSHELRTPLNAIIGFSELIHDGRITPASPNFRRYVGHIVSSARHLLQLISDVLDLAQIEAGRIDLRPQAIDLPKLVQDVVEVVGASLPGKTLRVQTLIDPRLTTVHADPRRLRQVLFNFLSNAWKFTPADGRVALRVAPCGPARLRVEVEDSGPGIAAADQDKLFSEFRRLGASIGDPHPGSGLGLALTKRIVEAQGGVVGVVSAVGEGSTFFAEIPVPDTGADHP